MPESQQPASAGNQDPVTMGPNTITEPLLAEASSAPSPKRRRAPAKRKPRSKAKVASEQPHVTHVTDLYDRVEQRIRNSGAYMRDNVMNAVVALGVVLMIVMAHWATQQEISTASQAVVAEVPVVVEVAPATEPITATATVEEPAAPLPPPPAESQPVVPTGTVIETSVSIRAPLDPTKPPPVVEPVVEAAPQAPTPPPVVRRAPAVRRRVRVTAAQVPAALLNDPYTNGGAMDLDAPTVRQHYLQQNQTMQSLSASRTE